MSIWGEEADTPPNTWNPVFEEVELVQRLHRIHQKTPHAPQRTSVSMKSDGSMDPPLVFRGGQGPSKQRIHQKTPHAPQRTSVSMKSDGSMDPPVVFKGGQGSSKQRIHQKTPDALQRTSVSMKSDGSMDPPVVFKGGQGSSKQRIHQKTPHAPQRTSVSMKSDGSMDPPVVFKGGQGSSKQRIHQKTPHAPQRTCVSMKSDGSMDPPVVFKAGQESCDRRKGLRGALWLSLAQDSPESTEDEEELAGFIEPCQSRLKRSLQWRFQCVFEGISKAGSTTFLNQIYTELYITEGGTAGVNQEHEVRHIEAASRKPPTSPTTIRPQDLFKGPPGRDAAPIRTVLTTGVAGIGKTVLTQKLTLDWAEDKANQDMDFIFLFTFRELNLLKDKKLSLVELVHHFFPQTKEAGICHFEDFQVVFILDGLDECRLPLDFYHNATLTDVGESTSVDVVLTNLIMGNLLPSALLWITTRPAAANHIPPECVSMVTEVRGFSDPQKEEYFRKRFREKKQATAIISHIRSSRSLHIMCHIPVFCWISAVVLEDMLKSTEGAELPKSLTEMYVHFLRLQTKLKEVKYDGGAETDPLWNPESRRMMESLGKLAFEQLQKGNPIFYESDLTECGLDIRAASVCSGVFTQIFREERALYQDKVFCFVHLSLQEFLAALHVHLTFISSGVNLLAEEKTFSVFENEPDLQEWKSFYQRAVATALKSPHGHLDLFLRFLLGLSLQTNQTLLRGLLTRTGSSSETNKETAKFIKEKISEDNVPPERSINLFHCMNELNDGSLVEEIQKHMRSGRLSTDELSPAQWSALAFILLSSEEDLDVFDLKDYSASEEVLLRLLPVVTASNKALLSRCQLSERGCEALSSVLSSQSCSLKQLDLSDNDLQDLGVKLLCDGLRSPHCHLKILSLSGCLVTEEGCASLASALSSNPSHLRELDLSYNHPGDSGAQRLDAIRNDPRFRLETLRVDHAGEQRLRPGLRKYVCPLTVDTHTVNTRLQLSDNNRKVMRVGEEQPYPDHPDRFEHTPQLLCDTGVTGRCYWEVEWRGHVSISVSYRGISRKGDDIECEFGRNHKSWSVSCCDDGERADVAYSVSHDDRHTAIRGPQVSGRAAVFVDCDAGTVDFYSVSSHRTLTHIHNFRTTFAHTPYPGFSLWTPGSSVCVCE